MSAIREVSNINTATARGDAKQQQRRTSQRPALRSSREPLRPSTGSHRTYPPVGSQNSSASEHARPSSASAAMGSVAPPRSQSSVASGWVAPPPPSNHRSSSSESPLADRPHADNPDYCTNIIQDITDMFIQRERQAVHRFNEGTAAHESNTSALYSYYASPHYLQYQPEITEKMRLILLDWLVDVHLKFKLRPETMYLTVNLVDRYLSCVNTKHDPTTFVKRSQVQLVGVSAMLLAAKYEEIWPPEVRECVHVAANTYTREEVITMERNICVAVSFRLTVPTAYPFAMRLLSVLEGEDFLGRGGDAEEMQKRHQELHHVTSFFMEHALLDYKGLQYTPSQIGYASVYLALLTMRIKYFVTSPAVVWSQRLRHYSSAELADFRGCAEVILDFIAYLRTTRFHSVTRKYTSPRFGEVTLMRMPLPRELTDA